MKSKETTTRGWGSGDYFVRDFFLFVYDGVRWDFLTLSRSVTETVVKMYHNRLKHLDPIIDCQFQ